MNLLNAIILPNCEEAIGGLRRLPGALVAFTTRNDACVLLTFALQEFADLGIGKGVGGAKIACTVRGRRFG